MQGFFLRVVRINSGVDAKEREVIRHRIVSPEEFDGEVRRFTEGDNR